MKYNTLLTPTEFHILLALRDQQLHGYQIIKQVSSDTDGGVSLLTGTLYNAIKRLLASDYIREVELSDAEKGDTRRKYYELTENGRAALGAELERFEAALRLVKSSQQVSRADYAG